MDEIISTNWQDHLVFGDDRPIPQNIIEDATTRVVLGALQPGQRIPVHPEEKAVYQFVAGEGVMTINGNEQPVKEGTVILVPAGALRGLAADTQLVFLAVRMKSTGV